MVRKSRKNKRKNALEILEEAKKLYPWAEKATSEYESSRNQISDYINATSNELIFTKGTTESKKLREYSITFSPLT